MQLGSVSNHVLKSVIKKIKCTPTPTQLSQVFFKVSVLEIIKLKGTKRLKFRLCRAPERVVSGGLITLGIAMAFFLRSTQLIVLEVSCFLTMGGRVKRLMSTSDVLILRLRAGISFQ